MKFISSIKTYAWVLVAMPLIFASCSKDIMDDINKSTDNPIDVEAKFILADVITQTAFSNTGGDISTYVSTYVEHEVGVHNQLYYAEMRQNEPSSSGTFNNSWGSLYTAFKNAKLIIEKTSIGGPQEGNDVTKGMAQVLAAYNLALITDLYGDAPWTEAGNWAENMTPKIDKQEEIYAGIMAYLDDAIINLQKADTHTSGPVGSSDFLYNGNANKWIQFAHGLKARYTMRLLNRSSDVNDDLQKVIDNVNLSFKAAADQAAFKVYDANNLNPLFDFQWSRDALAASRSMVDKLAERNDPRLRRDFVDVDWAQVEDATDEEVYELMAPNGKNEQRQYFYNTSIFVYSQTAPSLLLSYHEILFLKAEAMARLGNSTAAIEPILKEAVVAAIANSEVGVTAGLTAPIIGEYGGLDETTAAITTAEAEGYFDTDVEPLLIANPLKEIMNQKYIAFFGASGEATEAYSDIRRLKALGEDLIQLDNPGKFPLRLPYGNDDTTTNPEVKAAYGDGQYVYTEPVWWAGGTR